MKSSFILFLIICFCLSSVSPALSGEASGGPAANYLEEGKKLAAKGEQWEAIDSFGKALDSSPSRQIAREIYIARAQVFIDMGATLWAWRDLRQAKRGAPKLSSIPYLIAKALRIQRSYLPALEAINKALELEPYNQSYLLERIKIYMGLKRYEEAIEEAQKVSWFLPLRKDASLQVSLAYHELGNNEDALEEINEAIELDNNYIEARRLRANLLYDMGQDEKAKKDILFVVERSPVLKFLTNRRARLQRSLPANYKEELEKTLTDLELLLILNPDYHEAYVMMARVFLALSLPVDALTALDELGNSEIKNPEAYFLRGKAYRELSRHKEALKSIDKALALDGNNVDYLVEEALIYLSQGDMEDARKAIENAKTIDASNPFLSQAEGIYYLIQGEETKANAAFQKFDKAAPNPFSKTGFCSFQLAKADYNREHKFQRFLVIAADYPFQSHYVLDPNESMRNDIFSKIDFIKKFQKFVEYVNFYKNKFKTDQFVDPELLDKSIAGTILADEKSVDRFKKALQDEVSACSGKLKHSTDEMVDLFMAGHLRTLEPAEKQIVLRAFFLKSKIWKYKGSALVTLDELLQHNNFGKRLPRMERRRKVARLEVASSKKLYMGMREDWVVDTGGYYTTSDETVYIKSEAIPTLKDALFITLHELVHWMTVFGGLTYQSDDMYMVREGLANDLTFTLLEELDKEHPGAGFDYVAAEYWLQYYWYNNAFAYTFGEALSEINREKAGFSWPGVLLKIIKIPGTFFNTIGVEKETQKLFLRKG